MMEDDGEEVVPYRMIKNNGEEVVPPEIPRKCKVSGNPATPRSTIPTDIEEADKADRLLPKMKNDKCPLPKIWAAWKEIEAESVHYKMRMRAQSERWPGGSQEAGWEKEAPGRLQRSLSDHKAPRRLQIFNLLSIEICKRYLTSMMGLSALVMRT